MKELRIAGVSSMDDGNAFLCGFVERYNTKFAKVPVRSDNLHRALNVEPDRLSEIFCLRDKGYVTLDLTIKYDRNRIMLEVNDLSRSLVCRYVDVYELADGSYGSVQRASLSPTLSSILSAGSHMLRSPRTSASAQFWC